MTAYYNEIDKFAAQWLRELIKAGLIADGEVDERSITDVRADDLRGFQQCHFFAGIGGWSYALRLAGWPDDREAWTGSCPCQPWSSAGRGLGADDSRDLWYGWFRLIRECRPATVFGEQVASKAARSWLDRVCFDLEHIRYAVGAVDLPAAGVGAPHIRQRLWFVADAGSESIRDRERVAVERTTGAMSPEARQRQRFRPNHGADGPIGHASSVGHTGASGLSGGECAELPGSQQQHKGRAVAESSGSFWSDAEWLECRDGKARPVEPGTFPLAHGVPARVGRLRGYGNAIVPQVAQAFIEAYLEAADASVMRNAKRAVTTSAGEA